MRLNATNLLRLYVLFLVVFGGCMVTFAQPSRCDYPEPPLGPGGSVTCEEGQIAVCNMVRGRVVGECKPRSSGKTSDQQGAALQKINPSYSATARYFARYPFGVFEWILKYGCPLKSTPDED